MNILQIYEKYTLTKTLKEHMIRAASIGKIISDNFNELNLNNERLIKTLLLHDTGNIIKFDLEGFPKLLGSELKNIEYWKRIQKEYIAKYGNDEHKATEKIAKEINTSLDIQELLKNVIHKSTKEIAQNNNWEQKICQYADMRSGPFGVISVNERFDDLIERYKNRNHKISNSEKTKENRKFTLIIEQQLQEYTKISLEKISESSIRGFYPYIKNIDMHI